MKKMTIYTPPAGYAVIFTDWQNDLVGEYFTFLDTSWDINAAKVILRKTMSHVGAINLQQVKEYLPPLPSVKDLVSGLESPESLQAKAWSPLAIALNFSALRHVVETWPPHTLAPIILSPYGGSYLPIDGWHRIAAGLMYGEESLPAVTLTVKDSRKIASGNKKVIK